jgi:hypothetical protein
MKALSLLVRAATCAALSLIAFSAVAADYPTPQEGDWVARDFRFHTGEVMPDLRLHYTTVGAPRDSRYLSCTALPSLEPPCCRPSLRLSCSVRANCWM